MRPKRNLSWRSSVFKRTFSSFSAMTRFSSTMSLRRRFSLERLAASLFFLRFSQYEASFFSSDINSLLRREDKPGLLPLDWRLIRPPLSGSGDGRSSLKEENLSASMIFLLLVDWRCRFKVSIFGGQSMTLAKGKGGGIIKTNFTIRAFGFLTRCLGLCRRISKIYLVRYLCYF